MRGRSYFEANKKDTESSETIFKALTTVTKASLYTMKQWGRNKYDIAFYYPLVVYEGRLFQACLNKEEINVEEVDSVLASFLYESNYYKYGQFAIPVLKEVALDSFLNELDKTLDMVTGIVNSNLQEVAQRLKEEYSKPIF